MRPNQSFINSLHYEFNIANIATNWFKMDIATSSVDATQLNTVSVQGTFSRAWDWGSQSSHSTTNIANPRWRSNQQNSKSGILSYNHFGGLYFTSSVSASSSCTWLVSKVQSTNGADNIQLILRSPYDAVVIQQTNANVSSVRLGDGVNNKKSIATSNNTAYITSLRNDALRVNGVTAGIGSLATSTSSGQSELYFYTYGSNRGTASVYEIVHINGELTDSIFDTIDQYLKDKWNISY